MRLARRLVLLVALCALASISATAGAAETCTTAVGGPRPHEHAFDAPLSTACAVAVLVVTPSPALPGATVTLDGSQSVGGDAGDQIGRYEWDFGDGATDATDALTPSVTHAYARGVWTATLRILTGTGTPLDEASVELIVSAPPVAALVAPGGVMRPGVDYAFDASGSSAPGGTIASYDWDWGDGTTTPDGGPAPHHVFAADGASRQVSVTVVNDLGLAGAPATAAVAVHNELPLVQLIATPATVQVGQQVALDATGTSDPDGSIAEYRWDLDANGSFETSTRTTPTVTAGGFPNPGPIVLRVKAIDDSGGASVKGVSVTVARPPATGGSGGGSGNGAGGSGSGSGGGSRGSGASGGAGAGGSARDPFSVNLGGAAIQRLAAALRRGIGVQAVANRSAGGRLTMTVTAKDAKKLRLPGRKGSRPVTVGALRLALSAGRTAKPALRLTAGAARSLRRAKPRLLRITIRGAIVAGADSAAVVRVVLLRG